jgi:hypothetical protein
MRYHITIDGEPVCRLEGRKALSMTAVLFGLTGAVIHIGLCGFDSLSEAHDMAAAVVIGLDAIGADWETVEVVETPCPAGEAEAAYDNLNLN